MRCLLSLLLALSLSIALIGCGEAPPAPTQRVVHLDPRLADGRASADALAQRREVVRSWTFSGVDAFEAERGDWQVRNGLVTAARGAEPGVGLRLADYDEARGLTGTSLVLQGELAGAEINAIEIDAVLLKDGAAVLKWVPKAPRPSDKPADFRLEAPFAGGEGVQTLRFPLDAAPAWRGRIVSVDVAPAGSSAAYFELRAVRFVSVGFSPGSQPQAEFGGPEGDGGLLGVRGDLRRVWPSDVGVPLIARGVELPAGARVTVDVTVPGEAAYERDLTSVALDVRADAGEWQEIARKTLTAPELGLPMGWDSLTGDASALAGQVVDVRLRSWKGAPYVPRRPARSPGATAASAAQASAADPNPAEPALITSGYGLDGELERARVWWGVPLVLGELHADRRPNIVLVTLDTTRVDALGAYGGPARTPHLDRLAGEGLLFEQAWAACNSTLPSHTSILTGLSVPAHGLVDNRSQLDPDVETLAQTLREAGYHTAAAVSVHHLQAGYSGLGRGFDQYLDVQAKAMIDGTPTIAGVNRWLSEWQAEGDRPFFLWVHLFDPHTPYGPEAAWVADYVAEYGVEVPPKTSAPPTIGNTNYTEPGEFLAGVTNHAYAEFLYQAGVTFADELVGRLYGTLESRGFAPHTAFVVTADHGEALGEGEGTNAIWYDHRFLYDPILHVPLIVHLPGLRAGERVPSHVSLVDLAPTLLRLVGVAPPAEVADFTDLLAPNLPDDPVYFVHSNTAQIGTKSGGDTFFFNTSEYLQLGRELATPAGHRWLFDPATDPLFRTNRAQAQRDTADALHAASEEWAATRVQVGGTVRAKVSAEADATLDKLGYTDKE